MPKPQPKITRRHSHSEDRIITSKDLSKKGMAIYLFGDFLIGLYVVACIFLDLLIVYPILTYIPYYQDILLVTSHIFVIPIVKIYFIILVAFIEVFLIYFQYKGYLKLKMKLDYTLHERPPEEEQITRTDKEEEN